MLQILEIEAEVTQEIVNTVVFVRIASTAAASLLIGKDGQNLDALQYLVNRMIPKVVGAKRRWWWDRCRKLPQNASLMRWSAWPQSRRRPRP